MKDWKHLEQAIFGILHGCSDELDNIKSLSKSRKGISTKQYTIVHIQ